MAKAEKQKRSSLQPRIIVGIVIAAAFLVSAAVLAVCCALLGMIPVTYILIFVIIAVALTEAILFANRWKAGGIVADVISCLLIICFLLASFYVNVTKNTVQSVQSGDYTIIYVGVYVMDDDEAETLEDTAGYAFGYDTLIEEDATSEAIGYVEEILSEELDLTEYESLFTMVDELADGTIEAMILPTAYLDITSDAEDYEWTEDDIRLIETIEIRVEKETTEETEVVDIEDVDNLIIYISGIDSYGEVSVTSRSDVNILAIINFETKNVLLVTTPRDYYVTYEKTNGAYDKLTHAGLYGIDQSEDALETLYGVNIDYYVRMNFTGFEDIIDALGGITVYSECSFSSSVSSYSYSAGYNDLDGEAALYFARERKTFSDGDFQRGRNQMAVIEAVIDKLVSLQTLANFQEIMDAIADSFETDMPTSLINSLMQDQITNGGSWNVESYQVTGKTGSAVTYSAPGQYLSVVFQDDEIIDEVIDLINQTLYPEMFEDESESESDGE